MKKKTTPIVILMCKDHKKYKAVHPPKTDCIVCWEIYATRLYQLNKQLKKEVKELKHGTTA